MVCLRVGGGVRSEATVHVSQALDGPALEGHARCFNGFKPWNGLLVTNLICASTLWDARGEVPIKEGQTYALDNPLIRMTKF